MHSREPQSGRSVGGPGTQSAPGVAQPTHGEIIGRPGRDAGDAARSVPVGSGR